MTRFRFICPGKDRETIGFPGYFRVFSAIF